ncbi:MAG: hypothetical protein ACREE6_10340, partial [Limisphaerales bacterium]
MVATAFCLRGGKLWIDRFPAGCRVLRFELRLKALRRRWRWRAETRQFWRRRLGGIFRQWSSGWRAQNRPALG